MADSSGALQRPPSLKAFLDAGCDLLESGAWIEELAHLVFLELPFMPPAERRRQAQQSRSMADSLLQGGPQPGVEGSGPDVAMWWGEVLFEQWASEVYDDPQLAERVRKGLPTQLAGRYRALVDFYRRPYPMELRSPDGWWSCSSCGSAFDEDQEEALVITGREDHSEFRDEITYCFDCVGLLTEVVNEVRGRR